MSAESRPLKLDREDDRFARFRLIAWWDQELLARSRALVIGAGALGNELIKNLALLGVGQALICDMDAIESSNLSRSVLYREGDEGRPKAATAAAAARGIYPEMRAEAFTGDITTQLGKGVFRWADVVLGGLDNREARLFTNRACLQVGTPWVDGAIEALQGVVRAFRPGDEPCYECTLGENDWKLLEARRACSLLTRDEILEGRTPTTPTTSSVVAGMQCQEALKILHELDGVLYGQAYVFEGLYHQSYTINYSRHPDCQSHELLELIAETGLGGEDVTLGQLRELAAELLAQEGVEVGAGGAGVSLDFGRDVIEALDCGACGASRELFAPLGSLRESEARCACGELCAPRLRSRVEAGEALLERCPAELGLPAWDILTARCGDAALGLELDGDRALVLGRIADAEEVG